MTATGPRRAILFTQQSIGLGGRKTSLVFLAEALARRGADVAVVTVQMSQLSRLRRGGGRLAAIPASRRNRWYRHDGMRGCIWVPLLHPARLSPALDTLTAPLVRRYGLLLPAEIRTEVARCDLVIVESCAAVALFRALRRTAPDARFVYSMSDRLDVVGMHRALDRILADDAADYDLIRVPAAAMMEDFHETANVRLIPHGLDRRAFDAIPARSGAMPRRAVLAGDMMLDQAALRVAADTFPDLVIDYFGRTALDADMPANVVAHGEVPFATLAPFIKHADVGLALYRPAPDLDYLAQSSLKMLQYAYCRLPIVAPAFVADGLVNGHAYDPHATGGVVAAIASALAAGPTPVDRVPVIRDWDEVTTELLTQAGFADATI